MAEQTKTCKYCQTEIPKKAKICPNCKKKQGHKVWLIILIVIVVLGVIGAVTGGSGTSSGSTAPVPQASDTVQDTVAEEVTVEYTAVTAAELEDAIKANALKASETYKDQYLEISGCLNIIDSSGKYITLDAGPNDWTFVNIQCKIQNDDQKAVIMDLNKGDRIVVKGKCTDVGELLGYTITMDEISAQ